MKIVRGYTDLGVWGKCYNNDGDFVCYTIEREWKNNTPFESCIPEGEYSLVKDESPRWGERFFIIGGTVSRFQDDSFRRHACLFHKANWPRQLLGCVAPASQLGVLNKRWAGLHSGAALKRFELQVEQELDSQGKAPLVITHMESA